MDTLSAAPRVDIREQRGTNGPHEHSELLNYLQPLMRWMVGYTRKRRLAGKTGINHPLFDGLGSLCRKIRHGAASWQALDIIYNFRSGFSPIDWLWIRHMRNAQAVRNRKRLIVEHLHEECKEIIARKGAVKILSLASGSAQAVFESLVGLPAEAIEILLIDFDKAAGPYALELARTYGLAERVHFKRGNLLKFNRPVLLAGFQPDVIEMAGLLDYLKDDQAIELMRRIGETLPVGGVFLTCHIHDNPEREFMTEVIEWGRDDGKQLPMLYRSRHELIDLVHASGFDVMTLLVEWHRIHSVVVAKKT